MAILLGLIALSVLIHRQRTTSIAGVPVTPRAMALAILGITVWNLLLAGFLIGVEILRPAGAISWSTSTTLRRRLPLSEGFSSKQKQARVEILFSHRHSRP